MNLATSLRTTTRAPGFFDCCPECKKPMTVDLLPGEPVPDLTVLCDACAVRRSATMERAVLADRLRARYREMQRRGLVGEDLQTCSWGECSPEVAALNASAWREGRSWWRLGEKNLYIYGAVGVGKTWMARACLREAFVHGRSIAEVTARRLCKVSDTYKEGDGIFAAWKSVSVLLIDDLDKATWSTDRVDALWELLDARSTSRARTIITANLDSEAMRSVLMRACVFQGADNQSHAVAAWDRVKPVSKLHLTGESQRKVSISD